MNRTSLKTLALAACLTLVHPLRGQETAFPYPDIPDSLTTPAARGAWLLEHYWDRYDFSDTSLVGNPEITEQGFVNFCDLLPRFDSTSAARGVDAFSAGAFGTSAPDTVSRKLAYLTEHYLYDPESPLRSDALLLLFLDRMKETPAFSAPERERYSRLRMDVGKNMPGTIATDFAYWSRKGGGGTLLGTEAELLLLYFNDPDCDVCHSVTKQLSADSLFVANPRLKVLAVYPDEDIELWLKNPQPFPASWIDACSPGGEITGDELYLIRATPTFYLLDSEKRVILKDPGLKLLRMWLATYARP